MADTQSSVVILLDDTRRGPALVEMLSARGIDAISVEGTEGLHRALKQRNADILVIQQHLEGFLTGLEIVERLQANLFQPGIVLLGSLPPSKQEALDRLGIRSVLQEDASLHEIGSAITSLLADVRGEKSSIPFNARKLAGEAAVIRPLPQLLTKLCECLRSENISLPELANDISLDPRATAELLKITNSTSTGVTRKVASVRDAVVLLGLKRTIATVLSTGVLAAQSGLLSTLPQQIRRWYQTRSVLIATTAAAFADRIEDVSADTAHVLGMFQDLGVLVLANWQPKRYEHVLNRALTVGQVRLEQVEREEFGMSHADVSAALLERWGVPAPFVGIVLDHHLPERTGNHNEAEQRFLHVMRVAEAVANIVDIPGDHRHRALAALLQKYGARRARDCTASIELGVARAAEQSKLYSLPVPDEAAMQAMLKQINQTPANEPDECRTVHTPQCAADGGAEPERRQRILVIDDEASIRTLIERFLEGGFDISACDCADAAPAAEVDLILCDVHLGTVSGVATVTRLREGGISAPVIMISGDRSRETVVKCLEVGVVDYLLKPFTRATLVEKVQKHIRRQTPGGGFNPA